MVYCFLMYDDLYMENKTTTTKINKDNSEQQMIYKVLRLLASN